MVVCRPESNVSDTQGLIDLLCMHGELDRCSQKWIVLSDLILLQSNEDYYRGLIPGLVCLQDPNNGFIHSIIAQLSKVHV